MESRGLILWIGGASAIVLIYSGIKGESPLTEFRKWFGPSATDTATGNNATNESVTVDTTSPDTVLTSYHVGQDSSGEWYTYDQNGNPVGTIPASYAGNPQTYIPPTTVTT